MAVVATGFFDGVHLGHRSVVHALSVEAEQRGEEAVVVTFWPHPRMVMQQDARDFRLLTSSSEKIELLRNAGADRVEVVPFTKSFASLTGEQYIKDFLVPKFGCTAVVMGYDNKLGSDFADVEKLRKVSPIEVIDCSAVQQPVGSDSSNRSFSSHEDHAALSGGSVCEERRAEDESHGSGHGRNDGDAAVIISSTRIRHQIEQGNVESAYAMLGYDYFLNGAVVSGNRLGRTIGFPTANMELYEPLKLVPKRGVYLVRVELPSCEQTVPLYGMCNIGQRPTVSSDSRTTIETNIFDFSDDIYGLTMKITFLHRLRDEIRFSSVDMLRDHLESDRDECKALLK